MRCSLSPAWLLAALLVLVNVAAVAQEVEELSSSDLAAVKAAQKQRVETIAKVYGAVVAIYGNDRAGGGSGVLYDPAGFALTNHHVVAGAGTEGWGGLADGKLYRWKLIGTDPGGDVAIIQLTGKDAFPYAPLADSETVRVGDWAMAMGNPFVLAEDQRPTVTLGIVSGVHRFQEGSGMNQLVYGNCIQVDSSINPGNSGGPLFSLKGQVLGINGRGSFEERGRVNVGLGYAISANQCRMFIPELLATKVAQHGTLDAVFGTREGKVICHAVNLDSAVAKAGLQLGDKLIRFEGQPVVDANQFTNDLSMYPADWPVEVTWERDGKPITAHVRLSALPYEPIVKKNGDTPPEEKPAEDKPGEDKPKEEKPGEKTPDGEQPKEEKPAAEKKEEPAREKPADPKPAEEKPAEKPAEEPKKDEKKEEKPDPNAPPNPRDLPKELPKERLIPPKPKIPLGEAGKPRDKHLNKKNAGQIAARWREQCGASKLKEAGVIFRMESVLLRDGKSVGTRQMTIASANRCRVDYVVDGKKRSLATDGKAWWLQSDGKTQDVTQSRAMRDPLFSSAIALSALLSPQPLESLGDLALDGADKGRRRLCYRLSSTDKESEQFFVWLSVCDDEIQPRVQLQKTGVGTDDEEPIAAVVYDGWKDSEGLLLPWKATVVRGLAETPELVMDAQSCSALAEIDEAFFQRQKMKLLPNNTTVVIVALLSLISAPLLGADEADSPDGAFAEAIQIAQRRTVKIYGAGIGRSPAYASGILISSTGDVLTGNGVYLGADNLRVTLPDGTTYPATVVRRSQTMQVAQLKIEANTPDFFEIPEKPPAGKGDWILAVSNAFKVADRSEPLSVNIGVLSLRTQLDARRGVNDFPYEGDVFLYDAITSNPGAAGGAVVSTEGKLVGMIGRVIESKSTNTRLNYAVPADTLKKFVAGEEPMPMVAVTPSTGAKGELGIRLFNLGGRKSPAYIDRVLPGSASAKAGLKTDDMVISIGGEIVRNAGDFTRLSDNLKAGVETTIEVKRKNDLLTIKLTPTEAK